MDPQTAWNDLLAAYAAEQWDEVLDLAEGLLHWIDRGGFPPRAVTGSEMGKEWDREITLAGCRLAITKAQEVVCHDAS